MRPINWLHISDIHLRAGSKWAQDIVLKAMCEKISQLRSEGDVADFVLVTGDIAFSGKSEEYRLAEEFFEGFQAASGVHRSRIYCIPGNHDIDRTRQKMCFRGARSSLRNTSRVDEFLAGGEELATLLTRQERYRQFHNSAFHGQDRIPTQDGLGYVSRIAIEEVQFAIVALDSSWLAEGGMEDHGHLLIGERQAIDALELALHGDLKPHIILGMAHHPLHLLQEFDRVPVQNRLEEALHFFHCGHLHSPNTRIAGPVGSGCLTVAAGATFESREHYNAFSIVRLDLLRAECMVEFFHYDRNSGTFFVANSQKYPVAAAPASICPVGELAIAIRTYYPTLAAVAFFLAALALDQKKDVPISTGTGHTFGSIDVLRDLPDSGLKQMTTEFMAFGNVLRVMYGRVDLPEILVQHGDMIQSYGEALLLACDTDLSLRERLEICERESQMLADCEPMESFSHNLGLLEDLAEAREWDSLREHARRRLSVVNPKAAVKVRRMLALALSHSSKTADKEEAIEYYRALADSSDVVFSDFGNLAILLFEAGNPADAGSVVLKGLEVFPNKMPYFREIGQAIVSAAGDKELRLRIEEATRG